MRQRLAARIASPRCAESPDTACQRRAVVDRTLAAQALLAGIAERGADAVGYAYRVPGRGLSGRDEAAHGGQPPARPRPRRAATRPSCSSTSATTRRATRRSRPTTIPVRHGPVVGIHNGIILNDDELLAPHSCARAEPRMTVDSEAIFALAAHSRQRPARARGARAARWRPPGSTSASPAPSSPPAASAARSGSARAPTSSSSPRRATALEVVERYARRAAAQAARSREGTCFALARRRASPRDARFRPDRSYVEDDAAAGRPRAGRGARLPRAASPRSRRLSARAAGRRCRRADALLVEPLAARGTGTSTRRRGARRTSGRPATRSAATRPALARLRPVGELRQPPEPLAPARRPARPRARASPPRPARRSRPRAARSRASRRCASRATSTACGPLCSSRSRAVGVRPSSSPSSRSSPSSSSRVANRRGTRPAARLAAFQVPKCSITVCGWTLVSGSAANSRIVGERPSRSAHARSSLEDLLVGVALADSRLEGRRAPAGRSRQRAVSAAFGAIAKECRAGCRPIAQVVPRGRDPEPTSDARRRCRRPSRESGASTGRIRSSAATQRGQNCSPACVAQLAERLLDRPGRAVGARGQHRVERVGDVDDAGAERDLVAADPRPDSREPS